MNKKILSILIIGILLLGLTGCGKSKTLSITIVNNSGKTEELTAAELKEIINKNEVDFKENYLNKKIKLSGSVEKLKTTKTNCTCFDDDKKEFISGMMILSDINNVYANNSFDIYQIYLKEGFIVEVRKDNSDIDFSSLKNGQKITIESRLHGIDEDGNIILSENSDTNLKCQQIVKKEYLDACFNGTKVNN